MTYSQYNITGDYWDVYIYMGNLYLVTFENEIIICDWKRLENDHFKEKKHNKVFEINKALLERYIISKSEMPFKDLLSDICLANKKIYITNDEGFYCHLELVNFHKDNLRKLWDNKSFSLSTNGRGNIALSCGSDGLAELSAKPYDIGLKKIENNLYLVSPNHSTLSNYSGFDLYNISAIKESELIHFQLGAHFNKKTLKNYKLSEILSQANNKKTPHIRNHNEDGIISWLHDGCIYQVTDTNKIEVISYSPNTTSNANALVFEKERVMYFQSWKGKIISGASSEFGSIIECDNALVISFSENDFLNIPGEITKWRTYPNSLSFLNHLHVIQDDRIEIYRFDI